MNVKGIWLQYYLKEWSYRKNAEFSISHGLKCRENFEYEDIGTYVNFAQLDSDLVHVNQMLKCIKFGFGQCMDHACYDVMDGLMTREKAIEMVKKYDGKCAENYIKQFCNFIEIDLDEFWKTVEKFRGDMWYKDGNDWKNHFHDLL